MAPTPATVIRSHPSFSHFLAFSPNPTSLTTKLTSSIQIRGTRVSSPSHFLPLSSNSINGTIFKGLDRPEIKINDKFLASAASDGGLGGKGGGLGDSGDGNSGGNGGDGGGGGEGGAEGGGSNWSLLSWYLEALAKYPVLTKALTSALLNLIGDLACQLLIDQVSTVDLKRSFMFTLLGFALVGPTLHLWYLYLSKLVTVPGATGALLRLVLDQFLFSPIFIGVFMSTLMTLEGKPSQVLPKLKQEWFSAVVANWQLWIPFQFLNFRFVPQQFQVLAANVVALAWNVILSFKSHKEILQK